MCGCLVTRMKLQMLSLTAAEWSQTLVATRERALVLTLILRSKSNGHFGDEAPF